MFFQNQIIEEVKYLQSFCLAAKAKPYGCFASSVRDVRLFRQKLHHPIGLCGLSPLFNLVK
ncbi:hypothetical protein, partial [Bacillus sp. MUM 13]|uniref:hypothetical protein n=1 Tax=Bacillus sp. MUM 13 TaxID=1678001 RepID=UPI00196A8431